MESGVGTPGTRGCAPTETDAAMMTRTLTSCRIRAQDCTSRPGLRRDCSSVVRCARLSSKEVGMKRAFIGAVGVLAAVVTLGGQAKRPLAIEDYYRVLAIGTPQISADGKSATFTVATRLEEDNSTKTETFRVPAD